MSRSAGLRSGPSASPDGRRSDRPMPSGSAGSAIGGSGERAAARRSPTRWRRRRRSRRRHRRRADRVVDEPCREQVARRVRGRVADQHDRPAVLLADRVARLDVVIGIGCEYSSPLRTAASSDAFQGDRSSRSDGRSAMSRVNGVASTEKRVGWIGLGVNSCSASSAAQMYPPGLPRRSRISPRSGSSGMRRSSSAMNGSGAASKP